MTRLVPVFLVALALAPPASAAFAPRNARYGGKTSAAGPVAIAVGPTGSSVTRFSIFWVARCSNGDTESVSTNSTGLAISSSGQVGPTSGSFNSDPSTKIDFTLSMKVSKTAVTGSFQATATVTTSSGQVTCPSPQLSFKATRPHTFAGFHGAEPVTLRLSSSGRQLTSFLSDVRGDCTDGGPFAETAVISRKLKISPRGGGFAGSSTRSGTTPRGNHFVAQTTVNGRVKGSTASGKVRVRETFTSPSGQKIATCTSPSEGFSATRH